METPTNKRMSWTKLAMELDNMDVRTLKAACKKINRRLNAMTLKKKYKVLLPKQIELIKKHLGYL